MRGNHLLHSLNLKCDAAGCGYEEPVKEISRDFVGRPCPRCGASLLTEQDFESGQAMKAALDVLADILPKTRRRVKKGDILVGINPHDSELKLSFREVEG